MSKLRLLFAAAIAMLAFAAFASPASADTAEIDPAGRIENVSNGKLTFGSSITIQCDVTLNGTLAAAVNVTVGTQIGSVTEVRVANCTGGNVSSINDLPWPIRINEIYGELLNNVEALGVDLVGSDFTLSVFGGFVNCRYEGTAEAFIELIDTGVNTYNVGDTIADETVALPRIGGSGLCPGSGGFAGSFDTVPDQRLVAI